MNADLIALRDEEADSDAPLSTVALQIADEVLRYPCSISPSLCPDSEGGIRIEWHQGDRVVRALVPRNGLNSYIYTREAGQESCVHILQKSKCAELLTWVEQPPI